MLTGEIAQSGWQATAVMMKQESILRKEKKKRKKKHGWGSPKAVHKMLWVRSLFNLDRRHQKNAAACGQQMWTERSERHWNLYLERLRCGWIIPDRWTYLTRMELHRALRQIYRRNSFNEIFCKDWTMWYTFTQSYSRFIRLPELI